jgi:hypothetical protein
MTPASVASFAPVVRYENLDRLAVSAPSLADTSKLWTDVHAEVQNQLEYLDSEVGRRIAGARVAGGRTKGVRFLLFSYHTFSMPSTDLDPVVAGITFKLADEDVIVEADVSGEQTGDCIFSVPSKTVAHSREALLAAARESARSLCQSAEAIAAALQDPSRSVE